MKDAITDEATDPSLPTITSKEQPPQVPPKPPHYKKDTWMVYQSRYLSHTHTQTEREREREPSKE